MESKLVDRISILKVSNSDPCFQDDDQTEKPILENLQEPPSTPSGSDHGHDHQQEQPKKEEEQPNNIITDHHVNTPAKEERKTPLSPEQELINKDDVVEDDNDGFKTPTSLEHKIPVMKECPPAPRRPQRKRKVMLSSPAPSEAGRRSLNLNPEQLEALFSPIFLLPDMGTKIKKARRDHHDDTI